MTIVNEEPRTGIDTMLHEYAKKVGIEIDKKHLNEAYGRLLFREIVNDYQSGLICVDDLSIICSVMYSKFEGTELFDLLLSGSEIEWYLRWNPPFALDCLTELLNEFGTKWVNPKI